LIVAKLLLFQDPEVLLVSPILLYSECYLLGRKDVIHALGKLCRILIEINSLL